MDEKYDVVVVGAGGAGLYVAQLLGSYGLSVCLLDSKKDLLNLSFYTLGSFVDLKKLGLSRSVVAADVTECTFHSSSVVFTKKIAAYILDKVALHRELLGKATANGVVVKTSTRIVSANFSESGLLDHVDDSTGSRFSAKIFVDSTGLAGFLSKRVGLQDKKTDIAVGVEYNAEYTGPQNQSHLFIGKAFKSGYGWIFPLGNRRAIVGYGSFHKESVVNLKKMLDVAVHEEPVRSLIHLDSEKTYGGTIPITDVKKKFVYKKVVCIGDSVSQVNPLVGEGYRFVMEAGLMAAPCIKRAIDEGSLTILNEYGNSWNKKFGHAYERAKFFQRIMNLVSKNDFISDTVTRFMSRVGDARFQRGLAGDF